jgi:D-3-phosphoglycerate dehydrogenase
MHDMTLPASLKAVARAGAGVNNIPIDKCSEQGIVVFNTPGANANAVKELVIAGLLISSRRVTDGINWAQSLQGQTDVAKLVEKGKADFVGPEIMGKKLGVIGLGAIGVLVANACNALGMEVYGFDPFVSVDSAWAISRGVNKAASLDEIYANCDYITVHVPFNKDTKGMIGDESIGKMKDGVRVLNFARGELVDNEAIKKAVGSGKVSFYVTDFPNEELLGIKNIITIPHLGASSPESEENCAAMAAMELKDFLESGSIKNSVNFPNCEVPYTGRKRICVTHRNVPSVLSALTAVFSNIKINIDNMTNKSKGDYAYTVIDIDATDMNGAENDLKKVDGVISIRVI